MRVMQVRAYCRNRRKRLGDRIGRCGVDVDGPLASAIGFGLIVFGLIEAPTLGWWTKKDNLQIGGWSWPEQWTISPVPLAIGVGLVFIGLFIRWELHRARNGRDALFDLNLFKVGTFSWGNLTAATVAIGEFSLMFVLPLFFINSVGLSTLLTGLVLASMALGAFASGAAARHLAGRCGGARPRSGVRAAHLDSAWRHPARNVRRGFRDPVDGPPSPVRPSPPR